MNLVARLLNKVRPQTTEVGPRVLLGWYLRKGAFPALRGLFWRLRLPESRLPLFIGRRVSVAYGRNLRIGRGCVIGDGTIINAFGKAGIVLGDSVTLREGAWIQCASHPASPGEGLVVGSHTYIGPNVIIGIGGRINIGEGCQLGSGVTLIAENHSVGADGRPSAHDVVRKGISIGAGSWIGHRVTILDGVELGDNCVVGAGAVVTRSFPEGSVVAGIPARVIKSPAGGNFDIKM